MTARIGAVHLGWDVVSVAAGGGGTPIRPVQVEGTYTPPAYLLADSSGRLHTSGAERQRPDLGIAISDIRDVLGHHQIRIAGATWPVELVFRARLYNPLAAVGKYLRGKPDVVALPYPDDWPDEKVDEYCRLVELLDVVTEPLPESVALSGYVRALGLVHPPEPGRRPIGATGVYSDGRMCLVVAVHGDDEQPTESVGVPIAADAMREAQSADNVVIEVMAAARSIGADTSTVLLTGNVCFNDALRLAFQNHLGHRLRVADHPMHALVLGASHLLATDSEYGDEQYPPGPPPTSGPRGPQGNPGSQGGLGAQGGSGAQGGPGSPGNPGAQNSAGAQGNPGSQNSPGLRNNPGPQGLGGSPANPVPGQSGSAAAGGSGAPASQGNTGSQRLAGPPDSPDSGRGGAGSPGNSGPGHGVSGSSGALGSGRAGSDSSGATNWTAGPGATDNGRHALPTTGTLTPTDTAAPAAPAKSGRHSWRPPETASAEVARHAAGVRAVDQGPRHITAHVQPLQRQPEMVPRHTDSPPVEGRHAARETTYPAPDDPTTRVAPGDHVSRFTRPPGVADEVTTVMGRRSDAARASAGWTPPGARERDDEEDDQREGSLWNKVKDNLFGTPTIVGAVALAAVAIHSGDDPEHHARPADAVASIDADTGAADAVTSVDARTGAGAAAIQPASRFDVRSAAMSSDFGVWPSIQRASRIPPTTPECALTPYTRPGSGPQSIGDHACAHLDIDNLRYLVPTLPGIIDTGPPMHI
ncbi:hypothetical protein [Nocardia pseudobrasiliensis]|uniref:hypothetical protein n=1 Tax=Nocardia pseudobrasiliensis TaxID=45979 RepID=UPI001FE3B750|nr:hypothetical protein [Nocardia pseudobrasiliensis]